MVKDKDLVAIFNSVHRVMQAEKALKSAGADFLLIPVPRQLTSECGLAVRFSEEERNRIEKIFQEEGLNPAELYRREKDEYRKIGT